MMHRSAEIAVAEVARKIQNYAGPRLVLLDIREPFELALCDLRLHLLKNLNPECASAQGGSVMLTSTTTAKEPISSHATSKWRPRVRNQHISIEYDDDKHPPAPCLLPHVSFLHVPMGQIKIKMDQLTPFKNEEVNQSYMLTYMFGPPQNYNFLWISINWFLNVIWFLSSTKTFSNACCRSSCTAIWGNAAKWWSAICETKRASCRPATWPVASTCGEKGLPPSL